MQSILQKTTGIGPTPVHPEDLNGRVAVVVGGAFGIGFEISRALAKAGCRVIMVNRKPEHGTDAKEAIAKETTDSSSSPPETEWRHCDLGHLSGVREVFAELRRSLDRLDFLVLTAGINVNSDGRDADGYQRHFAVNYLGQFYVVNLLWPLLRKTSRMQGLPAPRVVFEASEMHRLAPSSTHFASIEEINEGGLGPTELYARTKLALILLAKYGLVERVIKENEDNIYAVSVHPGAVNTSMQQQWKDAYPGITGKLLSWAMLAGGRDLEQGSYSALWALTSPDVENGFYYTDPGQQGKESSQASDPKLGAALWDLSHRMIKEKLGDDALVDWKACD